jgi:hypothetical protein
LEAPVAGGNARNDCAVSALQTVNQTRSGNRTGVEIRSSGTVTARKAYARWNLTPRGAVLLVMDGAGIRQNAGNPQETGCSHGPTDASDLRPQSVCAILRRARGALHDGEVTLGEVVEALGRASFAPLIMLPALIVVTPASGIPLLSSICGITIALIAGQMLVQRDHIWLPRWLMRRSVSREKLQKALDWLDPIAAWVDRITKERLTPLVNPPFLYVLQLLCVAGGAVMPLMEFVPFTSSMMGVMVAFLSVAMVTRDGLLVLFGFSALGGLFYLANMVLA